MDTEQQLKEDIHTLIERYRKEEGGDGVVLLNIYSAIKNVIELLETKKDVKTEMNDLQSLIDESKSYLSSYQLESVNSYLKNLRLIIKKHSQLKTRIVFSRTKPKTVDTSSIGSSCIINDVSMNPSHDINRSNPFILEDMKSGCEVIHCEEDVLKFTNIDSSVIIIEDTKKSLHVHNITDSVIALRDINGSVMIHNATDCLFIINCLQIRIHNSSSCCFSLSIPNHPVIEDCHEVSFSKPCIIWNDPCKSITKNLYNEVLDFKWLKKEKSPNWTITSIYGFLDGHPGLLPLFQSLSKHAGLSFVE